jgi:hypothetical protein
MSGYSDSVSWPDINLWTYVLIVVALLEFPERPGALRKFLLGLHERWNISLFHYRNHGAGGCWIVLLGGC